MARQAGCGGEHALASVEISFRHFVAGCRSQFIQSPFLGFSPGKNGAQVFNHTFIFGLTSNGISQGFGFSVGEGGQGILLDEINETFKTRTSPVVGSLEEPIQLPLA